ncbi:MAG: MFS transporter [Erysipelotrichaceae bacterium]
MVNRKNIYLMMMINMLSGMVFYASIATLYRQHFGLTMLDIALIESVSLVLSLLLEVLWGFVADKIGYKKRMIICCLVYFISKIVFMQATNFGGFLLERILLAVVISGLSGLDTSIIHLSSGDKSEKYLGYYQSSGYIGLLVSSLVFIFFINDNYYYMTLFTAIAYFGALVLSFFLDEVKKDNGEVFDFGKVKMIFSQVIKNKSLLIFVMFYAIICEVHQIITVFIAQIKYTKLDLPMGYFGVVYILLVFASLSGFLSDRIGKIINDRKLIVLSLLVIVGCCFTLSYTNSLVVSIGCVVVFRFLMMLIVPLIINLENKQVDTNYMASYLSINALMIDMVAIGINLSIGKISDVNVNFSFLICGVLIMLSLVLFFIWSKRVTIK